MGYDLGPLRQRHGGLPVQRLTKAHIDALVVDLPTGGTTTAKGRTRGKWSAVAVNKVVATSPWCSLTRNVKFWSAATSPSS